MSIITAIYYHKISYYTKKILQFRLILLDCVGVDYNLATVKSIGGEGIFYAYAQLYNLIVPGKTQKRIELLHIVKEKRPKSIQELARLTKREGAIHFRGHNAKIA